MATNVCITPEGYTRIFTVFWNFFRLKALDMVLNGMTEAAQIVKEHEITLGSFDTMPADLNKLRAVHSQLLVKEFFCWIYYLLLQYISFMAPL